MNEQEQIKALEENLSLWQQQRYAFERELAITASAIAKFELQQRIQDCKQKIANINAELESLKQENRSGNNQVATQTSPPVPNMTDNNNSEPTIGIFTALDKEYVAVRKILENEQEIYLNGQGAGLRYISGEVFAKNGGKHQVILCYGASMGNSNAGIRASRLLDYFQSIKSIIMVGIAGGIPHPEKPEDHVRLGDVVISGEKGVIQYDLVKETGSVTIHRHDPRPPSASLLEGVKYLQADELLDKKPWLDFIEQALLPVGSQRPAIEADILISSTDPSKIVNHPQDPNRKEGYPRVFIGSIASGNILLKDSIKRDQLRDKFKVKAVEMEGSGISDATWTHEIGYLVIRGICDYCDANKNDDWQPYAAAVAAAYTRALLESMPAPKQKSLS